jgi:dihydroorotase
VDSRLLRRLLSYATGFGALIAHRPADPHLTRGAAATESEFAGRLGLPSGPAVAERIMLERDLALAELTGGRLLVDQLTTADALETLARGKRRGVNLAATASINHLSFNELDIGDYRTFLKLDPPLRGEDDRQALIDAVASGLVDIIVSAHAPRAGGGQAAAVRRGGAGGGGARDVRAGVAGAASRGARALAGPDPGGDLRARGAAGLAAGRLTPGRRRTWR